MAGEAAPLTQAQTSSAVPATAAGADASGVYLVAPFAGVVAAASIIANAALAGANGASRSAQLFNQGQAGAGAVLVAERAFVAGVNAAADDETALDLSVVPADLVVAEGDVLEFVSLHVGAGLAGPAFVGRASFSRVSGA